MVLDKPAGITSHGCVARVRKAYNLKRVGHGGTLDPAVTGVLPIALGPATRLLPYLPGEKTYRAIVQLGVRTTTDDLEGDCLAPMDPPSSLTEHDLQRALAPFRGSIDQRPPAFSAVHVQGQRAYALARAGETVVLPARRVTVHRLTLLNWKPQQGLVELEIHCSSGTYIRSLARDLGDSLGCGGALAQLRRTASLGFDLSQSVPLEALTEPSARNGLAPALPPLLDPLLVLGHLPQHRLREEDGPGWRCGQTQECSQPWPLGTVVLIAAPDGKLAGLAKVEGAGVLQPRLVLHAKG
ncbi:MAG: tRNA pseudouridine(55) synthase TruB [Cyanobium sp.]